MQIIVSGKQLDIGESLRQYAETHIQNNVKKHFEHVAHAHVTISKEGLLFKTDIIVEGIGTGVVIKGEGKNKDAYHSVEEAVSIIGARLSKYKNRIKNHRKDSKLNAFEMDAMKYVIPSDIDDDIDLNIAPYDVVEPLMVAEKQIKIRTMTVKDAVMQMDLQNLTAYLFINTSTSKLNLVYHHSNGHISWVDTAITIQK